MNRIMIKQEPQSRQPLFQATGAALFAEAYPYLEKGFLKMGSLGPITLPGVLGVDPWPVIAVLAMIYILAFVFFEKKGF